MPAAPKRGAQDPGICARKVSKHCTIEDGSNPMQTPLKAKAVASNERQAEGSKVQVPPSNAGASSHEAMTQHEVETHVEHPQFEFSSQAEPSSHYFWNFVLGLQCFLQFSSGMALIQFQLTS